MGWFAQYLFQTQDSVIEEYAESAIEDALEKAFNINDDALKNTIDFS